VEKWGSTGIAIVAVVVILIIIAFIYEMGRRLYFWIAPKIYKWTPQEAHDREMASLGIYSDVSGALRSYRRKRSRRGFIVGVLSIGAAVVPWVREFSSTDTLIWFLGIGIFWLFYQSELRLKTMQVRLAQMHDALERIAGTANEKDEHLISELSDY
jgi:hypothetical protein